MNPEQTADKPDPNLSVLEIGLRRYQLVVDAEKDMRTEMLDDLKFRVGEQWPQEIKNARGLQNRPCLTINRIPGLIRQVTNDGRQNRTNIEIDATDETTMPTAEKIEGMIRHIQVDSNADIAIDTARENQVSLGRGWIRLVTEYENDMSFDQVIKIKRIKNAFSVYYDPFCVEPDGSDARFAFITSDRDRKTYLKERPDSQTAQIVGSSQSLSGVGDAPVNWVTTDTIREAEYFSVELKDDTLIMPQSGEPILASSLKGTGATFRANGTKGGIYGDDGQLISEVLKHRPAQVRTVIWRKITAFEVIEEQEWPGKWIPVLPMLGDDIDVDGKRYLIGMIRDAKDPQRMYNYWNTAQTEAIALAPKAPWLIAEGQIEGYKTFWENANMVNHSHLVYKAQSLDGSLVPAPQRLTAEPPVAALGQAIQLADMNLRHTTSIYQASTGEESNEKSGRAIMARQHEGDVANFHYSDNEKRTQRFLGLQLLDLIPKIYDTPRMVRILHLNGDSEVVPINQPSGKQDAEGKDIIWDVRQGNFDVIVTTGPSYSTKRIEGVQNMVQIAQAWPKLLDLAGDIFFKNMDWFGAQEVSDRIKKTIPPQLMGGEGDEDQEIPPQMKAQLDKAHQMIDQLSQAVNSAHDQIDSNAQDNATKERIATQNNDTKVAIAAIQQHAKAGHITMQGEIDALLTKLNALVQPVAQQNVDAPVENDSMAPDAGAQGAGQGA